MNEYEEGYWYVNPPWFTNKQRKHPTVYEIAFVDDHQYARCGGYYAPVSEYEILDKVPKFKKVINRPEHCCGAQGFGLSFDDVCSGCEYEKRNHNS